MYFFKFYNKLQFFFQLIFMYLYIHQYMYELWVRIKNQIILKIVIVYLFRELDVTMKYCTCIKILYHNDNHSVLSMCDAVACDQRPWRKWNLPASVRRYLPFGRLPGETPAWKRCTWTPTTGRCAWPCRAIGLGHLYSLTTT